MKRENLLYLPPVTKSGQGYVLTRVYDSVHRGGVCPNACWDIHTPLPGADPPGSRQPPLEQTNPPPRADTLLGVDTLPEQCMLGDTGNKRVVRILLECILVSNDKTFL